MRTRRPKQQERSPAAQSERGADRGRGRAHGGKARRSLGRWTYQQVFVAIAGITSPAGRSVERTGAGGSDSKAYGHRRPAKFAEDVDLPAALQAPSSPSRPTCGPSRRLLVLLLQQQLDALSDE
jgi:hypothetical protein